MNDFETLKKEGIEYNKKKVYATAIDILLKAYSIKNNDNDVNEYLGASYFMTKDYVNAVNYLDKMNLENIESSKKFTIILCKGYSYAFIANHEGANNCVNKMLVIDKNRKEDAFKIIILLAENLMRVGNYEKACENYKILTKYYNKDTDPKYLEKLSNYAVCLMRSNDPDQAFNVYMDIYKLSPRNLSNLESLINYYYNVDVNYTECLKYIGEYITADPKSFNDKNLKKALCLFNLNKKEEAEKTLLDEWTKVKNQFCISSSSYNPTAPPSAVNLMKYYIEIKDYNKGNQLIKECKRYFERDFRLYELEMDILFNQKNYRDCQHNVMLYEEDHLKRKDSFFATGRLIRYLAEKFMNISKYEEAFSIIDYLLKLKDDPETLVCKAVILFNRKEYKKSIDTFLKSFDSIKTAKSYYMISLCFCYERKYNDSLIYLEEAISLKSDYINPHFLKIYVLMYQRKFDLAIKSAEIADILIPSADESEIKRDAMKLKLDDLRLKIEKFDNINKDINILKMNKSNVDNVEKMLEKIIDSDLKFNLKEKIDSSSTISNLQLENLEFQKEILKNLTERLLDLDKVLEEKIQANLDRKLVKFTNEVNENIKKSIESKVKEAFTMKPGEDVREVMQRMAERLKKVESEARDVNANIDQLYESIEVLKGVNEKIEELTSKFKDTMNEEIKKKIEVEIKTALSKGGDVNMNDIIMTIKKRLDDVEKETRVQQETNDQIFDRLENVEKFKEIQAIIMNKFKEDVADDIKKSLDQKIKNIVSAGGKDNTSVLAEITNAIKELQKNKNVFDEQMDDVFNELEKMKKEK